MARRIHVDPTDAMPIWRQIEDGMRRLVAAALLRPGEPVPSVRELAKELKINPATVAKAYHDLSGIEGIADRIAIIDGRKIVIDETIETLKSTYRRIRFDQRDGNIDFFRKHQGVDFRIVSSHRDSWGLQAVIADFSESCEARLRVGIADLEFLPLSLEEIFAATVKAKKESVS